MICVQVIPRARIPSPVSFTSDKATSTVINKAIVFISPFIASVIHRFNLGQVETVVILIGENIEAGCPYIKGSTSLFGQATIRQEFVLGSVRHAPGRIVVIIRYLFRIAP
ncbi:hypothetical protein EVA_04263 [gut metagenome]|uniref:Uncharacterized protein n=1 Tax=gut metagenome TaxID=749906 RepID=J9D4N6_9ZZZZ